MKIGLIGLGDIAKKAYLPVLSKKEGIELSLCTRNAETLQKLVTKYRIKESVQTVDELIATNIDAAFVSTATEAHFEISEKLLKNGIHVYIDKPISLNFEQTERIVQLAKDSGKIAMVGFNRRFIPKVRELREHGKPSFLLIQKNRFRAPDNPRRFIVEDFIHVVDTLRFLMNTEIKDVQVQSLKKGDLLHHLVVQLIGEDCTAVGIMNRDGGVTEETIEYSAGDHKYVIKSLVETTHHHNKETSISTFGDWEPTLYKRGFYDLVDHFIDCIDTGKTPDPSIDDSLMTHEICERIVGMIE
ncbi:Gfo/Idh/MocA family oxidoreductase [Bacillus sp. BHET2]|uniref:Gfo/Idh/MocA family protein n=1 Tax=Bacillus sp. BHET2 TaxID=2583818 RepID=UPI00110E391A|nr:Gfo/Idh/MocA family oxidoreductase [Bacillus sp. BHET2]TMU85125.1 Gfo/Idh/MocA family oxidoreductase [Bacillus sp. BHET2]